MNQKTTRITGIGNTLVDLIINESDQFIKDLGRQKGGMDLVESHESQDILSRTRSKPVVVTGGSTCNTIVGVANLGGKARFIGNRGEDKYGTIFKKQLIACNVEPQVSTGDLPTGRVLSIVTPDAQRTMCTYLGASTQLNPDSINPEMFKDTAITMVEGYLLFNEDLIMAALKAAKAAGTMIALDLSSFQVVDAAEAILGDLIKDHVDILIANEDEAKAYTGFEEEQQAITALSENVTYAVLKVGKKGSYISHNGQVLKIEPVTGHPPIDTTGAGDLWAAGFLYGLAHGLSIEKSGHLGSVCGYEVCQVMGAQLSDDTWERIKTMI